MYKRQASGPPLKRDRRPEDKGGVLGAYGLTEEQGNEIIMAARAHWFEDEEDVTEGQPADETISSEAEAVTDEAVAEATAEDENMQEAADADSKQ